MIGSLIVATLFAFSVDCCSIVVSKILAFVLTRFGAFCPPANCLNRIYLITPTSWLPHDVSILLLARLFAVVISAVYPSQLPRSRHFSFSHNCHPRSWLKIQHIQTARLRPSTGTQAHLFHLAQVLKLLFHHKQLYTSFLRSKCLPRYPR